MVMTSAQPGAVGVVQLAGGDIARVLEALTARDDWPADRLHLVRLADIDEGLAVRLERGVAQLMPHGGVRVMHKLLERLAELGVRIVQASEADAQQMYPEAGSPIEADMLQTLARAASSGAIDLLAAQPQRWRAWWERCGGADVGQRAEQVERIMRQTRVLDRLVEPASVVVVGPANVGKSTLTNRMLGRTASVVADLPGTTRDWVSGLTEIGLGSTLRAAVRWLDTPGLRDETERVDAVERAAIALAQQAIDQADVLIAMRDVHGNWPNWGGRARLPDVWVVNKVDDPPPPGPNAGTGRDQPLQISALHGHGVDALEAQVARALGLDRLGGEPVWAFSQQLKQWVDTGLGDLRGYLSARQAGQSPS